MSIPSMTFKEFIFTDENHFVAIEYYWLFMKRTFLILITKDDVIGIQGNSKVRAEDSSGFFAKELTSRYTKHGKKYNPYYYLKDTYFAKVADDDLLGEAILSKNSFNFRIRRNDIKRVTYDSSPKWGMGEHPHNGKVYIETYNGNKTEFIILGAQSCLKVVEMLKKRI